MCRDRHRRFPEVICESVLGRSTRRCSMNPRIGIMGGTFDPIHYGHLVAAEEACSALNLRQVIFVPTGAPPHKRDRRVSLAEDRYTMTLLATIDNPRFLVSRVEIDRGGSSHTVDTLREMRHWFDHEPIDFYFITGMDAVLQIESWKKPEALPDLCRIVAVGRPGFSRENLSSLPKRLRSAILWLEIPLLAISSTEIRQRVFAGNSIRYLVPTAVENFIFKKSLYGRGGV